jgi:hypothetical protein
MRDGQHREIQLAHLIVEIELRAPESIEFPRDARGVRNIVESRADDIEFEVYILLQFASTAAQELEPVRHALVRLEIAPNLLHKVLRDSHIARAGEPDEATGLRQDFIPAPLAERLDVVAFPSFGIHASSAHQSVEAT